MDIFLILIASTLLSCMLLLIYRAVKGPTAIDRVVAINIIGTKTSIILVIIGSLDGRVEMFVDIALTYALMSFAGSIAIARFYHKKHVRASEEMPHHEVQK